MTYKKLFSIKIPGDWAVIHNSFGDTEPVVEKGMIVNDEFYNEDLLSIEPLRWAESAWVVDNAGYALDLGWYPEANPNGCYRLTLLKGSWDNIILAFESKNRYQIHSLIERCFELISQGVEDLEISQQLKLIDSTVA